MRRLQTVRLDDNTIATVTADRGGNKTTHSNNIGDEATPTDRETVAKSQGSCMVK